MPPAVEAQSLNHWTTWEVPKTWCSYDAHTIQSNLQIQCNPYQNPSDSFIEIEKSIQKRGYNNQKSMELPWNQTYRPIE